MSAYPTSEHATAWTPYPVTLFDQLSARAAPPAERWVHQTAARSAAVVPMLSFQVTECSTDTLRFER